MGMTPTVAITNRNGRPRVTVGDTPLPDVTSVETKIGGGGEPYVVITMLSRHVTISLQDECKAEARGAMSPGPIPSIVRG